MHKLYENWNQFLMSEVNPGETQDEHEYRKLVWKVRNSLSKPNEEIINDAIKIINDAIKENYGGEGDPPYEQIRNDIINMLQQGKEFANDMKGIKNPPSDDHSDYDDDDDPVPLFEKRRKVSKKK